MAKLQLVVRTSDVEVSQEKRLRVLLRLSHNGKRRHLDTGVTIGCHRTKSGFSPNFAYGYVTEKEPNSVELNEDLQRQKRELLRKLQLMGDLALMDVNTVLINLKRDFSEFRAKNVQEWGKFYAEKSNPKYGKMVLTSLKYWNEFLPGTTRLELLDPKIIQQFQNYLRQRKKENGKGVMSEDSVNKTLSHIKAIINLAISEGVVSYKVHPFAKTKISRSKAKRCEIDVLEIQKLRQAILPTPTDRKARDMWLLSLYMGGMNYVDMMRIDWRDDDVIFSRSKTEGRVREDFRLPVCPEARAIVDKYMREEDGRLDLQFRYTDVTDEQRYINKKLTAMRETIGMPRWFCFVSARHSFAQICKDIGIPDSITNYMMAHADNRGIITSYNRVSPRVAGKVMERVIEAIREPGKYEDAIVDAIFRHAL